MESLRWQVQEGKRINFLEDKRFLVFYLFGCLLLDPQIVKLIG